MHQDIRVEICQRNDRHYVRVTRKITISTSLLLVKRKNILSIYIYVHIKYTLLNTVAVFVHGFTYMNI